MNTEFTRQARRLKDLVKDMEVRRRFGETEQAILGLFFDERLKVRRERVPVFYLYARLCERVHEDEWLSVMLKIDGGLKNLEGIGYLQRAPEEVRRILISHRVGESSSTYEVTAKGLEVLQSWHAALGVRLKAWIAVAPPWLVLTGSILGGVGALWKIAEFTKQVLNS